MAVEINVPPVQSGTRRLAVGRNTLILLISNFSSAAFGLLISILIARGAGDAALGTYSLALAWSLTLAQFADLGMSTLLTRDLARTPEHTASYLWASLLSKTALGIVLALALFFAAPALVQGPLGTRALQLAAALILFNAWYSSFTAIFRAFGQMLPILLINVIGLALQAALTWLLIRFTVSAEFLVALAVLIQFLQFAAAAFIYLRQYPHARRLPRTDWRYTLHLTSAGIPFAIAGILGSVEMRANILMLGALEGERAVGWYSAASRLNEGIRLAPNAFFGAVLPALAALGTSHNQAQLRQFFRRRELALIAFGGAAAIFLSVLAGWLIPFLYGESFAPAIPVVIVLGWGLIPALVSGLLILYLYARGDEHFVNWLIGVGLVVQVVAAFLLLRVYGAAGAAAATLISDCVLWLLLRQRLSQLDNRTQTNWRAVAFSFGPPLTLFVLALACRLVPILQNSFDGLYGQDAYAYYGYARQLLDSLSHLQTPPPFWWSLGYPALLDVSFLVGGINIASAQTITVLCGALIAPCAYALTRESVPTPYKSVAAWVAGLICAVSGQLVQSSIVIMADAPALFFATLGAWLLLRYARTRTLFTLSLTALAVGLSVWMRWQNLIFAAVWVAALFLVEFNARQTSNDTPIPWSIKTRNILLALALIGLVLSPQLFITTTTNAPLAGQSWLEGWSPANFFSRTFDTVDGHFEYPLAVALFYAQVFVHPAYLIALLTPLFLLGLWSLFKQSNLSLARPLALVRSLDKSSAPLVLLVGWILAMYLFLAGIPYENFRFSLGLFPPVAVLTGIGAAWLWHRLRAPRFRALLAAGIAIALALMLYWQPRVYAPILEIKARELDAAAWLTQQIPPGSQLWSMSIDGALETYTPLHVTNIWEHSAAELRATAPSYLFIDAGNIEAQWRDTPLGSMFRDLQASGHLNALGTRGAFTLFRIEP